MKYKIKLTLISLMVLTVFMETVLADENSISPAGIESE